VSSVTELPNPDTDSIPTLLEVLEVEWHTKLEYCDSCSSQSYYMVTFAAGSLFFCRHHFLKNEALIFEKALDIVDESELLLT